MNEKNNILNLANFLSITRMLSAIPLIYFLSNINHVDYVLYSQIVVLYIFLSDVFDGYFARKTNVVTGFGKIIDPVADKVCLWSAIIFLIIKDPALFLPLFILLSIRDFIITAYSIFILLKFGYVSQANSSGKFFIFITLTMMIFFIYDFNLYISYFLYILSILTLVSSTFEYLKKNKEKIKFYESV
tara:strand:- start:4 stop:564 length:561 start_codon:yes stop_codon:yes gene_type:complete